MKSKTFRICFWEDLFPLVYEFFPTILFALNQVNLCEISPVFLCILCVLSLFGTVYVEFLMGHGKTIFNLAKENESVHLKTYDNESS